MLHQVGVSFDLGSSISHCVFNWFWNRLWTSRKADYGVEESKETAVIDKELSCYQQLSDINTRQLCLQIDLM